MIRLSFYYPFSILNLFTGLNGIFDKRFKNRIFFIGREICSFFVHLHDIALWRSPASAQALLSVEYFVASLEWKLKPLTIQQLLEKLFLFCTLNIRWIRRIGSWLQLQKLISLTVENSRYTGYLENREQDLSTATDMLFRTKLYECLFGLYCTHTGQKVLVTHWIY